MKGSPGCGYPKRKSLDELVSVLENIQIPGLGVEVLFLDADDETLVRRYKETRRSHLLAGNGRVDDGIRMERERLRTLKEYADYILDTSKLLTRELKAELEKIFVENREFKNLMVTVLSFGFKYGIPRTQIWYLTCVFCPIHIIWKIYAH